MVNKLDGRAMCRRVEESRAGGTSALNPAFAFRTGVGNRTESETSLPCAPVLCGRLALRMLARLGLTPPRSAREGLGQGREALGLVVSRWRLA